MAKLSPKACRAARALLGWGVRDLANHAGVGFDRISAFENEQPVRESTLQKLQAALEAAGVEILNGNSPGARLRGEEP
jgi:transcriptional regulator with XRE-family HTH domain